MPNCALSAQGRPWTTDRKLVAGPEEHDTLVLARSGRDLTY